MGVVYQMQCWGNSYMTKPTIKTICFYLIIYQTLILCLLVHPCVHDYVKRSQIIHRSIEVNWASG